MTAKKRPEDKLKTGRPSKYTKALADKICRAISTSADGLKKLCAKYPEFPNPDTVREWRFDFPEFSVLYDTAKRHQADLLAEEIVDIADDATHDILIKEGKNGEEYECANSEFIQRSRLRVDARKWLAAKLLPKVYGEKITNETTVTIKHEDMLKELE